MSWIPNYIQAYCTQHNLINPTPMSEEWYAFNDATKKWVNVPAPKKSCFNCKHIHAWYCAATRTEPEDQGWECSHPDLKDWLYNTPSDDIYYNDEAFAQWCATDCPGYEFHDHETEQRQRDDALAKELADQRSYIQRYPELYDA